MLSDSHITYKSSGKLLKFIGLTLPLRQCWAHGCLENTGVFRVSRVLRNFEDPYFQSGHMKKWCFDIMSYLFPLSLEFSKAV